MSVKKVLMVKVCGARNLKAVGMIGKNDPFCLLNVDGRLRETAVIKGSLNPVWNQMFKFEFGSTKEFEKLKEFSIECTHKSVLKTTEIGSVTVSLKDFLKDSDDGKKWLQLTKKDKERGEIQLEITTE